MIVKTKLKGFFKIKGFWFFGLIISTRKKIEQSIDEALKNKTIYVDVKIDLRKKNEVKKK